jgi:soluble lytic murein transglycosylase
MRFIFLFLFSLLPILVQADVADIAAQRIAFGQAKLALQQHNLTQWQKLSAELVNYPLYPYLPYWVLTQNMDRAATNEVEDFLQTYSNTLLAHRLRETWLTQLAQQQQWALFLKYFQPDVGIDLRCRQAQALFATNQQSTAVHAAAQLWLTGNTLPATCDAAFAAWQKAGGLTPWFLGKRMELAMVNNNAALLKKLFPALAAQQQDEVKLWQLAQKDPHQAAQFLAALQKYYSLDHATQQLLLRVVAIAMARNHDPAALEWLAKIESAYTDRTLREWRVRAAIAQNNWPQVINWIAELDSQEQAMSAWQYWQAYAEAQQGKLAAAQIIFHALAKQASYYGWLAAQQLQEKYQPANDFYSPSQQELNNVSQLLAVQRAYELYALRLFSDARREWDWQINTMNKQQLSAAAYLAKNWGWYDRAMYTAIKANDPNDLTLLYPRVYATEIKTVAKEFGLDPAWVFAIVREESGFTPDVKSGAGALGLMQLLPQTGRLLAKDLNLTLHSSGDYVFLDTDLNIQLGSAYLKQLLTQYKGNLVMATAAYNIGPTNLKKYVASYQQLGPTVWIETLPWRDTRHYVKSVLLAQAIYQKETHSSLRSPLPGGE